MAPPDLRVLSGGMEERKIMSSPSGCKVPRGQGFWLHLSCSRRSLRHHCSSSPRILRHRPRSCCPHGLAWDLSHATMEAFEGALAFSVHKSPERTKRTSVFRTNMFRISIFGSYHASEPECWNRQGSVHFQCARQSRSLLMTGSFCRLCASFNQHGKRCSEAMLNFARLSFASESGSTGRFAQTSGRV